MFRNFYIVFLFLSIKSLAQEPVTWSTAVKDNGSGNFTLITKAEVSENWRLYALNLPEGGALPTEFNFVDESIFESFSKVNEPNPTTKFDPIFQMEQSYFTNEVFFYQENIGKLRPRRILLQVVKKMVNLLIQVHVVFQQQRLQAIEETKN